MGMSNTTWLNIMFSIAAFFIIALTTVLMFSSPNPAEIQTYVDQNIRTTLFKECIKALPNGYNNVNKYIDECSYQSYNLALRSATPAKAEEHPEWIKAE